MKYAERKKLKASVISKTDSSMTLTATGNNAYQIFRHESGKHVVQRVPPTESNGRRHTSVVSVAVLPVWEFESKPLPSNEVDIKTQGGHGPGGQHQNKKDSAVRATHKPTGIQVFINGRKQSDNKKKALQILAAKVNEFREEREKAKYDSMKSKKLGNGDRSGKIRTYNFIDSRVTDHRFNIKTKQIDKIMKGRFDLLQQ